MKTIQTCKQLSYIFFFINRDKKAILVLVVIWANL